MVWNHCGRIARSPSVSSKTASSPRRSSSVSLTSNAMTRGTYGTVTAERAGFEPARLSPTRFPGERTRPLCDLSGDGSAEREGFEPSLLSQTAFRERHHQPLGHLSARNSTGRAGSEWHHPRQNARGGCHTLLPMPRFHYAWIIVGVTLVTLMAAQAVRAA